MRTRIELTVQDGKTERREERYLRISKKGMENWICIPYPPDDRGKVEMLKRLREDELQTRVREGDGRETIYREIISACFGLEVFFARLMDGRYDNSRLLERYEITIDGIFDSKIRRENNEMPAEKACERIRGIDKESKESFIRATLLLERLEKE